MVSPIGTWMTEPAPARRRWSVASRTAPVVSVDSGDSLVTVENPDGSTVTVPALSGVYSEGSLVRLTESPDGRVVFASAPDSIPDGAVVEPVGEQGARLLESHVKAVEAWEEAKAAREDITAVDSSARAAEAVARNAEMAAQLTQQALDAATEAQRLENEALKEASDAARSTADSAASKAGTADSRAADAQNKADLARAAAQDAQVKADSLHLQAENKSPNWSFENGPLPWGSNFGLNPNHVVSVSDAWHGAKVVQSTINSGVFHWVFLPFENAVPTELGRVWEARARVRTVGGEGRAYAGFRTYQANGKWNVPGSEVPGLKDGQWETITYRYKSTSAAVRVTPLIGVAAERGTVFQIDAVELRDVTEAVAAQAVADAAKVDASKAQAAADEAKADAGRAQSTADAAKVDASKAQAAADAARAKADELAKQAQDAMEAAQQAQTSADGKALVAYSDYQPATVSGQKIIWFKPGSVPMLFDGKVWRSVQPGDGVVSAIDIDKATVGELSGMRIKAGTASVDILIPGENARWTSSGLTIYHPLTPEDIQAGLSPTDWEKRSVALNLTSEGSRFISVADEAGTVTAYMSPQGEVSGRELTITGQAAVDTLQVGGLELNEVISLNSSLAAYSVIPALVHPAGFAQVLVAQTGWQTFPPGLYTASWPVSYRLTRQSSGFDAMGAYLTLQTRPAGGGSIIDTDWVGGDKQSVSWASSVDGIRYGASNPIGVFEAKEDTEYRFGLGLHSYLKWQMEAQPSIFKVERLNPALELTHTVYNQSSPPAPPPPKTVTASAGLTDLWYAYGSTFAQSGSYQSGGNFRIPGAKGKKIRSIKVTGRCNFDFMDGGAGASFSFHLGGENKSAFVRDYGAVDLTYGSTAGATLSSQGYVGFRLNNGAPAYNEYNAGSFRCTVTYQ